MDKEQKKVLRQEYNNYLQICFKLNENPISFYKFQLGFIKYKLAQNNVIDKQI